MVAEVLEHLEPARGGVFVDCTVGLGGHARALLEAGASRLIGIDRDPAALEAARVALREYGDRVELVHSDYRRIADVLDARGVATVDGLLADLGVSSMQLDAPGRGFSFRRDDPLDMRMDTSSGATAAEMIPGRRRANARRRDLRVRRGAPRAASGTGNRRGERTRRRSTPRGSSPTSCVGPSRARGTRGSIRRRGPSRRSASGSIASSRDWTRSSRTQRGGWRRGGRMAVITFHSLEDRIVKHTLRGMQAAGELGITVRTKRPVVPGEAEVERNPRARSAKLRAVEQADDRRSVTNHRDTETQR